MLAGDPEQRNSMGVSGVSLEMERLDLMFRI
jgi:hypothetical protein